MLVFGSLTLMLMMIKGYYCCYSMLLDTKEKFESQPTTLHSNCHQISSGGLEVTARGHSENSQQLHLFDSGIRGNHLPDNFRELLPRKLPQHPQQPLLGPWPSPN